VEGSDPFIHGATLQQQDITFQAETLSLCLGSLLENYLFIVFVMMRADPGSLARNNFVAVMNNSSIGPHSKNGK
jgi:hypothetical protein